MRAFIQLAAVLCFVLLPARGQMLINSYRVSGGVAATYLINQGFEGTGYDTGNGSNGGTWTPSGTVNPDYTVTVLAGSQSFRNATGSSYSGTPFSGLTTCYFYCLIRFATFTASSASTIEIYTSGGLKFVSGGTCELAMSTTGTKPSSDGGGNVFLTRTGASGTAAQLYIDNPAPFNDYIVDHVLVDDAVIGNSP
jgi:hypothetical protein